MADIQKVAVLGAGTMGHGIAQVCATVGMKVAMRDISDEALAKGRAGIEKSLHKLVEKGKIEDATRASALEAISTTTEATRTHHKGKGIMMEFNMTAKRRPVVAKLTSGLTHTGHATASVTASVTTGAVKPFSRNTRGKGTPSRTGTSSPTSAR